MVTEKMAFSVDQAADTLGVHANTIRKMISDGRLNAVCLGRKYLIPKFAIDKFLKSNGDGEVSKVAN